MRRIWIGKDEVQGKSKQRKLVNPGLRSCYGVLWTQYDPQILFQGVCKVRIVFLIMLNSDMFTVLTLP